MSNVQNLALSDNTLKRVLKEADVVTKKRLNSIRSSFGLADLLMDISKIWEADTYPIKDITSFNGDKAKFFIYRSMVRTMKLEIARRRLRLLAKDDKQYLASVIRANKIITSKEYKIEI